MVVGAAAGIVETSVTVLGEQAEAGAVTVWAPAVMVAPGAVVVLIWTGPETVEMTVETGALEAAQLPPSVVSLMVWHLVARPVSAV
jgi:hypothetical protein